MSIRIEKISVQNCGPIPNFNQDLMMLNIIHSRNEGGKSLLVEFIIRCLFKNKSNWGYLRELGNGKVTIAGLDDRSIDFGTGKGKKLEDYFEKNPRGLPSSLVKLLVVKGGETEIVKGEAGIDKDIIKNILSQRRILDSIAKKISSTIKGASITDSDLNINNQGEGREFKTKRSEFGRITEVIDQFTKEYEQGELKDLKLKEESLVQKKELLLKAKRYKAYKLSQEIIEIESKINVIPAGIINDLRNLIVEYEAEKGKYNDLKNELEGIKKETEKLPQLKNRKEALIKAKRYQAYNLYQMLKRTEVELKAKPEEELNRIEQSISKYHEEQSEKETKVKLVRKLRENSKDYEWLKMAKENYYKFLSSTLRFGKMAYSLPIASFISLVLGLTMVAFDEKIFGILLVILAAALIGVYYLISIKKSTIAFRESKEFQSISTEFKNRFGSELKDITHLESLLSQQEKIYNQLEVHQDALEKINIDIKNYVRSIEEGFKRFNYDNAIEANWSKILFDLKDERKKLLGECQRIREELAKLEVDESDYELNDPGMKFSKSELERIDHELTTLSGLKKQENKKNDELNKLEGHLNELSREIKTNFKKITQEELANSDWKDQVSKFEKLRNELLKEINKKQGVLNGLGISENEYEKENPGKEFTQFELDDVEKKLKTLDQKVKEEADRLSNLKASICSITDADISTNWTDLIDKLYVKKERVNKEIEEIEAKIISGIVVHQTIKELQQEEDQKLIEGLNSEEVRDALIQLTGKYKELSFEDADIVISDEYNNFLLKDLSTGAKEQVMLALRIGFLKKLFKQENAFLILDDAFQHSDYVKRPILVKTLFQLANDGWQIIYLTMDDHIRDLFRKISRGTGNNLKEISLN